jgi:outer membrane protein assembly factor BamB
MLDMVTPNQYGALAYLWSTGTPAGINTAAGTTTYNMYDAMTGNYILSIVNGTSMILTEDEHGDLVGYYVNSTDNTLNVWNSTACINLDVANGYGGPNVADNWSWRPPQGAQIPFALGITNSWPLATDIKGTPLVNYADSLFGLGIIGVNSGVVLTDEADIGFNAGGYTEGWIIEAGYSATTGAQLWITNRTEIPYSIVYGSSIATDELTWMGNGVYVELTEATLTISGYSLTTGDQVWGPISLPNVSPFASLGVQDVIANGTIYIWTYGGDVYAYNLANGALIWQYHTPSGGYESPYGIEPLWAFTVGTVAGGELFVPEGHMYSPPLFHGAQQLALNITNGQVVWSIEAFDVTSAPAVSDGIATTLNAYDNQIYAYGMGPSKTAVNAPDPVTSVGSPMVIRGTVTDISAGSQQNAVAANFPNGLPCVSDASMSQFMEAVYEQQTMPTNVTGVPVTISVIDSNGNTRVIGTPTSDASGMFTLTWIPDISGNYTVTATFAGTQSYYGSSAQTSFYAIAPAPTASPYPVAANPLPSTEMYIAIAAVAMIVAIIIVGALIILTLRKRP